LARPPTIQIGNSNELLAILSARWRSRSIHARIDPAGASSSACRTRTNICRSISSLLPVAIGAGAMNRSKVATRACGSAMRCGICHDGTTNVSSGTVAAHASAAASTEWRSAADCLLSMAIAASATQRISDVLTMVLRTSAVIAAP
jgi:hypothetical protein